LAVCLQILSLNSCREYEFSNIISFYVNSLNNGFRTNSTQQTEFFLLLNHGQHDFVYTCYTLRWFKGNFQGLYGDFITQTFALWLFMFLPNVNPASCPHPPPSSPKRKQVFVFYFCLTQNLWYIFTILSILLYSTVDMEYFLHNFWLYFFHDVVLSSGFWTEFISQ
jgi:hypothetical protein